MVGAPGEAMMTGPAVEVELELEPRVAKIIAVAVPAATATIPILAHLEDHQCLDFSFRSPMTLVTFVIEMVVSPTSLPREAETFT
jgi:hypothetical protein